MNKMDMYNDMDMNKIICKMTATSFVCTYEGGN